MFQQLIIGSEDPIDLDFKKLKERFLDPGVKLAMQEIQIPDAFLFLGNIWFLEDQMNGMAQYQKEKTCIWNK